MENERLDEACIKPNYEDMYIHAEREKEIWRDQYKNLMEETIYLRGVKHTLEAIVGRKIGDGT